MKMGSASRRAEFFGALGDERGAVLVLMAIGLVGMLIVSGLAIDLGRGYVLRAQLSRAVDAAALAGARSIRAGTDAAEQRARAVAAANGFQEGVNGSELSVAFGSNEFDEQVVQVTGRHSIPTLFMRVINEERIDIASVAVAAVPPLDLVLVLDQSGSLGQANAWDDLQDAARQFVRYFDEDLDQIGMVSFQIRATHHFQVQKPFVGQAVSAIDGMRSVGYTNTGEGLRLAYDQFQGPNVRERAAKVVVFFTDGRPTAFRGIVPNRDRVLAASSSYRVSGFWNDPDNLPMNASTPPDGCVRVPRCFGYDRDRVFGTARENGLFWASQIREEGILVYTIGLGDTSLPPNSLLHPDQEYLRLLANEDGISDSSQPRGKMYFAPSAMEIRAVFNLVAQDLLARLSH